MEWDNITGDKKGVSAPAASVMQLLHKLEISCLLIVTFKVAIWKKQAAYVSWYEPVEKHTEKLISFNVHTDNKGVEI